jgi:hypothetical protein
MRESMQFLAFWAWLTSLKMLFSNSIHLPADDKISFFFVAEKNPIVYKHHIFFFFFFCRINFIFNTTFS